MNEQQNYSQNAQQNYSQNALTPLGEQQARLTTAICQAGSSHNHEKHDDVCAHAVFKYCPQCDTVECTVCFKEWTKKQNPQLLPN